MNEVGPRAACRFTHLAAIYRRHPWLVSAIAVTSLIAVLFAVRLTAGAVYWAHHQQETIQPWMTAGYVGRSWGVDPRALDEAAGLPQPTDHHRLTLQEIANQRHVPVDTVITQVETALTTLKTTK